MLANLIICTQKTKKTNALFLFLRVLQLIQLSFPFSLLQHSNPYFYAQQKKKALFLIAFFVFSSFFYAGYFSLINDKGVPTATLYTTITKLVREKVYKFLSVDNLTAYTESQSTGKKYFVFFNSYHFNKTAKKKISLNCKSFKKKNGLNKMFGLNFFFISDTFPARPHYVKGTARGGQVFRLLAVFEDGKQDSSNQQSGATSFKNGSNAGRYAQLLNENRQVIYVSLTSKGKFYEIEDSNNSTLQRSQSLDPNANGSAILKPKQDFADCVHRISNLISMDVELPINIRFIAVSQQNGMNSNVLPETITITKVTTDNCVIACPIEEPEVRSPLHLKKISITPEMRFIKCFLGFENEIKMFSNPNVQNILKYCQFNCDNFTKTIEVEHIATVKHPTVNGTKHRVDGLKILRPLNFPKLLRREKSMFAHEKEDSIIFLSKNDLENMESKEHGNEQSGGIVTDKMNVFQSTKKKWFRNSKSNGKETAGQGVDTEMQSKRMSLDRYQDMSKLIQERFGGDIEIDDKDGTTRASSEIGVDPRRATIDSSELRQKSMSMQDMDSRSDYSVKPDLVNFKVPNQRHHSLGDPTDLVEVSNDIHEGNKIDFMNQKSFITEKLCSEFHVKTRNHSKSSTNLQQLLHFSVPQKMNVNETKKDFADETEITTTMKAIDFASMVATTCIDDDLPYSSVRDSLVYQPAIEEDALSCSINGAQGNSENIYAEICTEASAQNGSDNISIRNGSINGVVSSSRSAIRISVSSSTSNSFEVGSSSVRHSSIDSSTSTSDNIYNTIK